MKKKNKITNNYDQRRRNTQTHNETQRNTTKHSERDDSYCLLEVQLPWCDWFSARVFQKGAVKTLPAQGATRHADHILRRRGALILAVRFVSSRAPYDDRSLDALTRIQQRRSHQIPGEQAQQMERVTAFA